MWARTNFGPLSRGSSGRTLRAYVLCLRCFTGSVGGSSSGRNAFDRTGSRLDSTTADVKSDTPSAL
jgi:hypothetical protein